MSPLDGYRIGITSARRADELTQLLERRGAFVVSAPALTMTPNPDDRQLRAATAGCIDSPPDLLVASTGVGMRGWVEAAATWQIRDELLRVLRRAEILTRGAKATGAVRAVGLRESWASDSESMEDVLAHLRGRDLLGKRIVIQEHGAAQPAVAAALRLQGARVTVATVYRCEPALDQAPLFAMVDLVADRQLDAVTFTSAPSVHALMDAATASGRRSEFLDSLRTDVVAACVGPVTAEAWQQWSVPTITPSRFRLAALVREIALQLPDRRDGTALDVGGHRLLMRAGEVLVDGREARLTPAPHGILRVLAERPGQVVSRRELMTSLPSGLAASEHAVEAAVARLRAAIGADLVRTVVKRGYRLAVEPSP